MDTKRQERKQVKKAFYSQDETWRIEAVIHDGNWYDIEKWMKVAKVKNKSSLFKWIDDNKDILIKSNLDSYRVGYDEVIRWYKQENLDLEESIVPNNFPPKLWDKTTETDAFAGRGGRR